MTFIMANEQRQIKQAAANEGAAKRWRRTNGVPSNTPPDPIFVVIRVHYDCYRFQDNLGAFSCEKKATELARKEAVRRGQEVVLDCKKSYELDEDEVNHIYVESFNK